MNSRIFIIHPSIIIREGVFSLIKITFNHEARILGNLVELENFKELKNQKLIFIIDDEINQKEFLVVAERYKLSNEVKILLIRKPGTIKECEDDCNCCFYTDITLDKFELLLRPYLISNSANSNKLNSGLTGREVDVVKLVAFGKTNKEIADELCISKHTVISHRKNITEKLGIKSISGLTVYAILNNLIDAKTIDPESLI